MGNQSVVHVKELKEKVTKAHDLLFEVMLAFDQKTIVQTVSTPEPPKKVKKAKGAGRPKGSKNKAQIPSGETLPLDQF